MNIVLTAINNKDILQFAQTAACNEQEVSVHTVDLPVIRRALSASSRLNQRQKSYIAKIKLTHKNGPTMSRPNSHHDIFVFLFHCVY